MFSVIFSIGFWLFLILSSCVFFGIAVILWIITAPFDKRQRALHYFTCFWASIYTWINPYWNVNISGRNKIKSGEVFVIVCNHQSMVDVFVLFRLFFPFKWVSKAENFWLPFIGWNMALNRYIKLVRGSAKSKVKMLNQCGETLKNGTSVLIFPEGTRSGGNKIRSMKRGAFQIAKDYKVNILPLVLNGSSDALPRYGVRFDKKHTIDIRILDTIQYETFADLSVQELTHNVQSLISKELERMRAGDLLN